MRVCNVCNKELPEHKFGVTRRKLKDGSTVTYKDKTCMVCRRKAHLEKPGKREVHRLGTKNWQANNPEKVKEQNLRKYGITLSEYDKMRVDQNFCCSICGVHESDAPIGRATKPEWSLQVDHNHSTGKVRALLCVNCNNLLGKAGEDVSILANAIKYLEKHNGDS